MVRPGGGFTNISSLLSVYHARDYNGVTEAVSLAQNDDTGSATVLVSDPRTVPANLTIPSNVALVVIPGGKLTSASGVTLTINGPIDAGAYQIFDLSAGGEVALGAGACAAAYLEWWGGGAGATAAANDAALTAALAAVGGAGVGIAALGGVYQFAQAHAVGPNVVVEGRGRELTTWRWTGATNGLSIAGGGGHGGRLRGLTLDGQGGGLDGVSASNLTLLALDDLYVTGWTRRGLYASQAYLLSVERCLFTACGSSIYAVVEVDQCTTFRWRSYISGGNSGCVAGLRVNRTSMVEIGGGDSAIESCGIPIVVQDMAQGATPVAQLHVRAIDLENPGNGNPYIQLGRGWSGAAGGAVQTGDLSFSGSPSGTASVPTAVDAWNCTGVHVAPCGFGTSTGVASVANVTLEGTGNARWTVDAGGVGLGIGSHVSVNGALRPDARPDAPWSSEGTLLMPRSDTLPTGATPSVAGLARASTNNASATTVTNLLGGRDGQLVVLFANDVNTTIAHAAGGGGQIYLVGGVNLLLPLHSALLLVYDAAYSEWRQVRGT